MSQGRTGLHDLPGLRYYRALARSGEQLRNAVQERRLEVPVLAIGSEPVGVTLARQLAPLAENLQAQVVPDCGHLVPVDAPGALLEAAHPFLSCVTYRAVG